VPWLKGAFATCENRWAIDHIGTLADDSPRPFSNYSVFIIDSGNSIEDGMALHMAIRKENGEAAEVLLMSQGGSANALEDGQGIVDAVLVRGTDDQDVDLLLRYFLYRKQRRISDTDQLNFDPKTGFARSDMLARILDLAIRQAKRTASFVALLSMGIEWLDVEGEPVQASPALTEAFAKRLGEVRRSSDFVCIDQEGAIHLVLIKLHTSREIEIATNRIVNHLLEPFGGGDDPTYLAKLSVGVAHTVDGRTEPELLIAQARTGLEKSARETVS
jgi:GGDEF domain-containing protein